MSDGLDQIERLARLCLARVSRAEKRKLLATLARDLRAAQATRIAAQRQPDGEPFAPRRPRRPDPPGAYSIRFLYPRGDPNPRAVLLRSWVHQDDVFTGLDVATGKLRSYRWDKVVRFLPVAAEQRAPGPRLPQRGKTRARDVPQAADHALPARRSRERRGLGRVGRRRRDDRARPPRGP